MTAALEAGRPVNVHAGGTLADGLLVPRVGTNAFALCRRYCDKVGGANVLLFISVVLLTTQRCCNNCVGNSYDSVPASVPYTAPVHSHGLHSFTLSIIRRPRSLISVY